MHALSPEVNNNAYVLFFSLRANASFPRLYQVALVVNYDGASCIAILMDEDDRRVIIGQIQCVIAYVASLLKFGHNDIF